MLSLASFMAFLQILLIDISLAGDNAIVVGTAAAGLPPGKRHQAVLGGIGAATVLRILFAVFAVQLLHITGLLATGGLLLIWVAWKMYRDIRRTAQQRQGKAEEKGARKPLAKTLREAIIQITVADVSMSLDNVLGVAGVANNNVWILIAGLTLSIFLMGCAATLIARVTTRYPWIAYLGLAVVLYTALHMIWEGGQSLMTAFT